MSEPPGSGATQPLPVVGQARQGQDEPGRPASGATPHPLPTLAAEDAGGKASRFWSPRRVPAALLALLIFGGAGLLLYDIVAVRAGHPAMRWRRELAHQLGERPLDDAAVLAGAAVAALAGLWLIVLAATPGQRALLPMRRTGSDVRAGLDRGAAATVLRDRAMDVSGVQSVRVRMTRSKVNVRAVSHFRELDDVRGDLDATLADGIRDLGLARAPGLSVHVARPGKKG
ncbi:DUF6286 domain-containing protein [Streptomyces alboniger]|uniref:DUF6286 domain-containing protein n=1 Tax=Streptomyces alboniger TaxID=132473 RepID=A0A5J6HGC0_STRAD|nr:DUF6286 domain-containing protein [Streptomyces alboniger]QEV17404.1 hypothetical protein CP975_07720 [Streptomyces alboniger]